MPNIRVPETPELGLRPSEVGVEARAATARRIGHLSNQVAGATRELAGETRQLGRETAELGSFRGHLTTATGQRLAKGLETAGDAITDYFAHKELSLGAKTGMDLTSDLTDKLKKATDGVDPNDTSVIAKFREETLEPALDKFREGFNTEKGRLWAEHYIARTREHFVNSMTADLGTMAKQAGEQNINDYSRRAVNTAYKDPSAADHLVKGVDADIGAIADTSGMNPKDRFRVKTDLAERVKGNIIDAAAQGALLNAPPGREQEIAATFKQRWPQYIDPIALDKAAKGVERANRVDAEHAINFQKKMNEAAAKEAVTKSWNENVSADPSGNVIIKPGYTKDLVKIRGMPDAPQSIETELRWSIAMSKEKKETVVTNQEVKADLYQRLSDPDVPTSREDILRAEIEGKLSAHDRGPLLALQQELEERPLRDPLYKEAIAAAKDKFTHIGIAKLPGGEQNFNAFMQQFLPEYLQQKRAGTLKPNALDMRDPTSLISQAAASAKPALPQQLQGLVGGNLGGTTAPITPPRPAPLKNIGDLQYNVLTNRWRSKSSGKVYDAAGNEVK